MVKSNSRGSNPNSHGNNPKIGERKMITLPDKYWELTNKLGVGNYAQGIRKAMQEVNVLVKQNLDKIADILSIENSYDAISEYLDEHFPAMATGRKGVEHLMSELMLGESYLSIDEEGQTVCRVVKVLELKIFSNYCPGKVIKETKQVWHKTGKTVERNVYVSEKITQGFDIEDEVKRAISEELGLDSSFITDFKLIGEKLVLNPQSAYKGIDSYSKLVTIEVWLKDVTSDDIYIEHQPEKDFYFSWVGL